VQAITSIAEIRVGLAARLPDSTHPCSCHEQTSDRGAEQRHLDAWPVPGFRPNCQRWFPL